MPFLKLSTIADTQAAKLTRMEPQQLERMLTDFVETYPIRMIAEESLRQILFNSTPESLGGYHIEEVSAKFVGYQVYFSGEWQTPAIRTRIGLFTHDPRGVWTEGARPIGYYEQEHNLLGELRDDFLVIEVEKHIDEIRIASHIRELHSVMPLPYLRRNHPQFEFVSYISMIATLFVSGMFQASGTFICRAHEVLNGETPPAFALDYLAEARSFLQVVENYLVERRLLDEATENRLRKSRGRT